MVCTNAVAEIDVGSALANLQALLNQIDAHGGRQEGGPLLFVKPWMEMAAVLNDWPLMKHVDGFVVPADTEKHHVVGAGGQ